MKKSFLESKWFNILYAAIMVLAGILVVVFAIVRWASNPSFDPTLVLRIVVGVTCLLIGIYLSIKCLVMEKKSSVFLSVVLGSSLVGVGIFMFFKESGQLMDTLLGLAFPLGLAAFGFFMLPKGIILTTGKENRKLGIGTIIVGAILLTIGIVFVVYRSTLVNLSWIFVGLVIAVNGLANLFTKKETVIIENE